MRRPIPISALTAFLVLTGGHLSATPVLAAVCDGSTTSLTNGGFEAPGAPEGDLVFYAPDEMPPWQTTDGAFEIWGDGFQEVPAGEGGSFAELNAFVAGTLYQDVVSTPGESMQWSLLHRARAGTDVMRVLIGDANLADPNGAAGWDFTSTDISDDTTAWGAHTGVYVVPAGQTCTRFAFRAVSSGSGSASVGNFLDGVGFAIAIPPTPGPTPPAPAPTIRVTQPPTDTVIAGGPSDQGGAGIQIVLLALAALAVTGAWLGRRSRRPRSRRGSPRPRP